MIEHIKVTGRPVIILYDENGNEKTRREVDNLVVTVGKNWIAGSLLDTGDPAVMSHMAVGSGTTAPVIGDTTLETEEARVALSSTSNTDNKTTFSATFDPGVGTAILTEAAIFNAASNGTMLARVTFAAIAKNANDTLSIAWDITIN